MIWTGHATHGILRSILYVLPRLPACTHDSSLPLTLDQRGLVPSIKYSNGAIQDQILTESAIVAQFLAEAHPSGLLPPLNGGPEAALARARINFFIDTWNTKVGSLWFQALRADSDEEKEAKVQDWVAAVKKEIEPLLADASPYFAGSKNLTLAEVCFSNQQLGVPIILGILLTCTLLQVNAAPFILRWYALQRGGLLPASLKAGLDGLPNFAKWAATIQENKNVTAVFDEQSIVAGTAKRIAGLKAKASA